MLAQTGGCYSRLVQVCEDVCMLVWRGVDFYRLLQIEPVWCSLVRVLVVWCGLLQV